MQHVRLERGELGHAERVLEHLHPEPDAVQGAHARRQRVEPLPRRVPVRRGNGAEAEPRRDELDVCTGGGERRSKAAVVGRGVGRRVGEDDAHGAER